MPAWAEDALALQSGDAVASSDTETTAVAAALQSGHGFFGTFWTDPIGLTVSDAIDEARWNYDGVRVSNVSGNDGTYVLSPNGWRETYRFRSQYINAAKTWATVYTEAVHQTSSWFPSPTCGTTKVKYYANNVYGGSLGQISGGVNTWTVGPCGGLLAVTAMTFRGT